VDLNEVADKSKSKVAWLWGAFEGIRPNLSDEWDFRIVLIAEEDDGNFLSMN